MWFLSWIWLVVLFLFFNFHPYLGKQSNLTIIFFKWVVQPPTSKLSGITYLVGKISRSNFYCRVPWLSEKRDPCISKFTTSSRRLGFLQKGGDCKGIPLQKSPKSSGLGIYSILRCFFFNVKSCPPKTRYFILKETSQILKKSTVQLTEWVGWFEKRSL